jgi:type I restriction enzyme, R subunit
MSSVGKEPEYQTRKRRIDPRLMTAGWSATPFDPASSVATYTATAVEEFETTNGPADYALCDRERIQAVVEAKKLTVGPQGVLTQAERYSKGV